MNSLWLRVRAPFAAFRWMQAGVFRATSPVMPPSTAWGLVLNLASIEIRDHSRTGAATFTKSDVPKLDIAVGVCAPPVKASLYQQLHSYPVNKNLGKELKERSFGNKYWIAPVRRELLVDYDGVIGVRGDEKLLETVQAGLAGNLHAPRYGLPFAGDNNFLFDDIQILPSPPEAYWYCLVDDGEGAVENTCRLTVCINRDDASRTNTRLFSRSSSPCSPPDEAWVTTPTN